MDKNKSYALSLEGGGFRGAYQAGVIYALAENNLTISAVCGTSIGALNGALVAAGKIEKLKELWLNFEINDVFHIKSTDLENFFEYEFSRINFIELGKDIAQTIYQGGLNIDPLISLINNIIDEDNIRKSSVNFGLVTYNLTEEKGEELMIRDIPKGLLCDYLMASAYLPVFKQRKLHGKKYFDGGIYNNLPSNMLANAGYDDIIEIRLHKMSININPSRKVNIKTISSNEDLGALLLLDKEQIKKNFNLGYQDGINFCKDNNL